MRRRTEWTQRPPKKTVRFDGRRIKGVCIHYAGYNIKADPKTTLGNIQNYHLDAKGWFDIAYNIAVGLDGSVWELRGLEVENGAQGGRKWNRSYVAVSALLGPAQEPTEEMIEGIKEAVSLVRERYPEAREVIGHRELKPTSCPGDPLQELIDLKVFSRASKVSEKVAPTHTEVITGDPQPVKKGDQGPSVKRLQKALQVTPDGDFGPKTEARLFELQRSCAPFLGPVNGKADLEVWRWVMWVETL